MLGEVPGLEFCGCFLLQCFGSNSWQISICVSLDLLHMDHRTLDFLLFLNFTTLGEIYGSEFWIFWHHNVS